MNDKIAETEGPLQVDTGLVRQLAEMLNESDLSEIEVQDGGRRIVVKRKLAAAAAPAYHAAPAAIAPAAPPPAAAETPAADHPGTVKSPMVCNVYMAGQPGAKPFIQPGDKVSAGDTLLIVEAMKVMNPITAPRDGTVKQVLVQDAQPIEFDQPLVIVE